MNFAIDFDTASLEFNVEMVDFDLPRRRIIGWFKKPASPKLKSILKNKNQNWLHEREAVKQQDRKNLTQFLRELELSEKIRFENLYRLRQAQMEGFRRV